jgi:hypothetical protein
MKESKKIVSALIVMALLFMTSYTLLLPNNRPLFAQIRVIKSWRRLHHKGADIYSKLWLQ